MTLHMWKLDDGEQWWIAAETAEEALAAGKDVYAIGDESDDPVECEMVPDDEPHTVNFVDGIESWPLPEGAKVEGNRVTATAAAWARCVGRGILSGSTVF